MTDKKQPLSLRNRNLLNVKVHNPRDPWFGQVGTDAQGHAIFGNVACGLRAAIVTVRAKQTKSLEAGEELTLRYLIEAWAPASDGNDPAAYTDFVVEYFGKRWGKINPDYQVSFIRDYGDLAQPLQLGATLTGMAIFETGAAYRSVIEDLFDLHWSYALALYGMGESRPWAFADLP